MDETTPQLLTITRRFPALALSRVATRSEGLQNFVVGASQVGKQAQAIASTITKVGQMASCKSL